MYLFYIIKPLPYAKHIFDILGLQFYSIKQKLFSI